MEATRAARVEQRRILGEYYRDLATNYREYEDNTKMRQAIMASNLDLDEKLDLLSECPTWPDRPNIPLWENA